MEGLGNKMTDWDQTDLTDFEKYEWYVRMHARVLSAYNALPGVMDNLDFVPDDIKADYLKIIDTKDKVLGEMVVHYYAKVLEYQKIMGFLDE
jgi:hypothetical protein